MLIYHLHAAGQLNKPNLLLMDLHYVHVFNYWLMQMVSHQDIKVFMLEPHTSHLTPSQHSRMPSMKFNRRVGERSIQKSEFFSVFNVAWDKAMTSKTIKAGYKRTGIWPVNRAAIPSYTTELSKICKCNVVLVVILLYSIVFICIELCLFFS